MPLGYFPGERRLWAWLDERNERRIEDYETRYALWKKYCEVHRGVPAHIIAPVKKILLPEEKQIMQTPERSR
jgi:hypothetical protein